MLKIKDKFIDHSENVECAIDRVSLGNDNQIIIQHRLSVGVTFKDWWKFFTGQDCLHVTTKTIIEYEETNNTANTNNTITDNSSKKSSRPKKPKTTSINSEPTDSK